MDSAAIPELTYIAIYEVINCVHNSAPKREPIGGRPQLKHETANGLSGDSAPPQSGLQYFFSAIQTKHSSASKVIAFYLIIHYYGDLINGVRISNSACLTRAVDETAHGICSRGRDISTPSSNDKLQSESKFSRHQPPLWSPPQPCGQRPGSACQNFFPQPLFQTLSRPRTSIRTSRNHENWVRQIHLADGKCRGSCAERRADSSSKIVTFPFFVPLYSLSYTRTAAVISEVGKSWSSPPTHHQASIYPSPDSHTPSNQPSVAIPHP